MSDVPIKVGDKVRFSTTTSSGATVTFSARVAKMVSHGNHGQCAWVEYPDRVRKMPFPPNDGKKYGLFTLDTLRRGLVVKAATAEPDHALLP